MLEELLNYFINLIILILVIQIVLSQIGIQTKIQTKEYLLNERLYDYFKDFENSQNCVKINSNTIECGFKGDKNFVLKKNINGTTYEVNLLV